MTLKHTPTALQEEAIALALSQIGEGRSNGCLVADEPGAGKTTVACEVILRAGWQRALIIALPDTHTQWADRLAAQSDGAVEALICNGTAAGKTNFEQFMKGEPGIYIAGADFLRQKDWEMREIDGKRRSVRTNHYRRTHTKSLDGIIFDECFVAGTMIDTPNGPTPIEDLREGDEVFGFDHSKREVIVTRVKAKMERKSEEILSAGCTPNHPYFIAGDGYRPAGDIRGEDQLYVRDGARVRMVRADVCGVVKQSQTEVLQQVVREQVSIPERPRGSGEAARRAEGVERDGAGAGSHEQALARDVGEAGLSRVRLGAHDRSQPIDGPRGSEATAGYEASERGNLHPLDWREWSRGIGGAGELVRAFGRGVAHGVLGGYWGRRTQQGIANELQGRYRASRYEDRGGVRRSVAQLEGRPRAGRPEGSIPGKSGVDHLAILEPRDRERFERVRTANRRGDAVAVYNIETGSSNYFAAGVLVHNCHAIANKKSKTRATVWSIKAKFRLAMSGTWARNDPANMWSVAKYVWPGENPETGEFYVTNGFGDWAEEYLTSETVYANGRAVLDTRGNPVKKLTGEKIPGQFVSTLPAYRRLENEDRVPEPVVIYVQPTPEQAKQLADLEQDFLTWVMNWSGDHEPLVADIPIVLLTRMRQACIAALSFDENGDVTFAPDAASAKLAPLRWLIEEHWPNQPVAIYTDSKVGAKFIEARMRAAGVDARAWTGDLSKKERAEMKRAFIAGEFPYLIATVQSFGTGIDGAQQVCNKVVWISEANGDPALNDQAIARFFRPGRTMANGGFEHVKLLMRDSPDVNTFETLLAKGIAIRAAMTLAA